DGLLRRPDGCTHLPHKRPGALVCLGAPWISLSWRSSSRSPGCGYLLDSSAPSPSSILDKAMDQHDSRYWVEIDSARKPAVPPQVRPIVRPSRSRDRRGEILSLLLLSLFLVDTFLPWQQQCFSVGGL